MVTVQQEMEQAFSDAAQENSWCAVGRVIAEHEAGEVIRVKTNAVESYSASTISRVLRSFQITVSTDAINKHRKGLCRCLPDAPKMQPVGKVLGKGGTK